jgi:hypothetical protein
VVFRKVLFEVLKVVVYKVEVDFVVVVLNVVVNTVFVVRVVA